MLPGRQYSPEDLVALAWRRKRLIVAVAISTVALVVGGSLRLPDLYESETLILVIPQRVPESYVRSTVTVRMEDRLRSISQQILSRSRLERIIEEFDLYPEQRATKPMEQVVALMRNNVSVNTVRDDSFSVRFVSTSPRTSMIVADRLASLFIEENLRDRELQATGTNEFLETQLDDARTRLMEHENRLEAYRKRHAGELPSQLHSNLQVLQSSQRQIQDMTDSLNRDLERRRTLEREVADAADDPVGAVAPSDGGGLADQLARAESELQALEARRTPEHPDVIAKRRMIARLQAQLEEAARLPAAASPTERPMTAEERARLARHRKAQSELDALTRQIAGKEREIERLRGVVADYQRRVEAVPEHESELTALMRDYTTLQQVYADLLAKKENSRMSASLEQQQVSEQFRVIDPARLPIKPFSPNRARLALLALAAGLVLGCGIVAFREYRDVTLRTEDDVVRLLTLPVVAAVPPVLAVTEARRQRRYAVLAAAAGVVMTAGVATFVWAVVAR